MTPEREAKKISEKGRNDDAGSSDGGEFELSSPIFCEQRTITTEREENKTSASRRKKWRTREKGERRANRL